MTPRSPLANHCSCLCCTRTRPCHPTVAFASTAQLASTVDNVRSASSHYSRPVPSIWSPIVDHQAAPVRPVRRPRDRRRRVRPLIERTLLISCDHQGKPARVRKPSCPRNRSRARAAPVRSAPCGRTAAQLCSFGSISGASAVGALDGGVELRSAVRAQNLQIGAREARWATTSSSVITFWPQRAAASANDEARAVQRELRNAKRALDLDAARQPPMPRRQRRVRRGR